MIGSTNGCGLIGARLTYYCNVQFLSVLFVTSINAQSREPSHAPIGRRLPRSRLHQRRGICRRLPSWSTWKNQRGSIMKVFMVQPNGTFSGLYINNTPGFACQGLPGFPLTGRTSGNKVTFTVVWNNGIQNCNSTTVWYGIDQGTTMPTK